MPRNTILYAMQMAHGLTCSAVLRCGARKGRRARASALSSSKPSSTTCTRSTSADSTTTCGRHSQMCSLCVNYKWRVKVLSRARRSASYASLLAADLRNCTRGGTTSLRTTVINTYVNYVSTSYCTMRLRMNWGHKRARRATRLADCTTTYASRSRNRRVCQNQA